MTVLDWLKASTRYSFSDENFIKIAKERGVSPTDDAYGANVTERLRRLMEADIIFTAVLLSPSNTASISESHAGYQQSIGQEQDFYQNDKIKYAISLYRVYDDPRGDILEKATKKAIRFVPIVDVDNEGNPL